MNVYVCGIGRERDRGMLWVHIHTFRDEEMRENAVCVRLCNGYERDRRAEEMMMRVKN